MGPSLASFITSVGQGKYYVFLICNLEKHLHFQEKVRKSQGENIRLLGKMCMNPKLATLPKFSQNGPERNAALISTTF